MIELYGDITEQHVDAIVNSANCSLLGGAGVDGAIHRAAGPQLLEACLPLRSCPTGEARITPAFNLPARYVIHAVAPIWRGGEANERELLARAYRSALALAEANGCQSVAFPVMGSKNYEWSPNLALQIARDVLAESPLDVRLVRYGRV